MSSAKSNWKSLSRTGIALALTAGGIFSLQFGLAANESVAQAQSPAAGSARLPALRQITQGQYQNTIAAVFGADIAVKVRFAPLERVDGLLAVGASRAVMTGGGIDPLEATARAIAEQVVSPERRDVLIPCKPSNPNAADEICARAFLSSVGRYLYRRPVRSGELDALTAIAGREVGHDRDFYSGLAFALSGMLVSPQFLYVWENVEADPTAQGGYRLDGYSKAARLSLLLWNTGPDDELLKAAERGDLHKPEGLRREVNRMISSPLYRDGVRAFFDDFLVNETFETLSKDTSFYPAMTAKAIGESREQLLRTVVDHLVDRHGDYRDLFTTRHTFMTSDLAVLYKVPLDTGSQGWVPYQIPAGDPRVGIQGQIGFLAKYSHPARSSATRRGRAVREVLLCQRVPDPPPNVDFSNFEGAKAGSITARDRLSIHNENPVCAGCHALTDPIGLSLENFDGAGQFRTVEGGKVIDVSGELDGVPFQDPVGLGSALRDNPSLKSCIVNRLYAYSVGQQIGGEQEPLLAAFGAALEKRGYRFDDMLRLMIMDKSFFAVQPLGGTQRTALLSSAPVASKGGSNAHQVHW